MALSTLELILWSILFVGIHFGVSSTALRPRIIGMLGEKPYLALYSILVTVFLVMMIIAFREAPKTAIWGSLPVLRQLPLLVMPLSLILLVGGMMAPNPSSVGQGRKLKSGYQPTGIQRISRHPTLVGFSIWGASHILAKGDLPSLIFFGAFLVLSLLGPGAIDRKRQAELGEAWEKYAAVTSVIPFQAIVQGRNQFVFAEIGWWRVSVTVMVYVFMLYLHPFLFGVVPL